MITTIDHNKRKRFGLGVIDYVVADFISQQNLAGNPIVKQRICDYLDITMPILNQAFENLRECSPQILILESDNLEISYVWYSLDEIKTEKIDTQLIKDIINRFNILNDTKYSYKTYELQIQKILKNYKHLTLLHFESVFQHKYETWGTEPDMALYNRPATLFRNPLKFIQYLDEATRYWSKKSNQ